MTPAALKLFIHSLILEAKDKQKETKQKEETKLPKSSGKLIDLKKELAALKQMKSELEAAKFAEKTASTEVEFASLSKFAAELDKIKTSGVALEQKMEAKIQELEDKVTSEKNKVREMIGMAPKAGQEKMVDEKKEQLPPAPSDEETAANQVTETRFKKGTDIGKKGKGFEKIEKTAAKQYGSKEAGKKVAGAILKKVIKK